MRLLIGWVAMGGALLACASCGFKGPLYLPEHNTTVITHPAPAAPKKQKSAPASTPSPPQS